MSPETHIFKRSEREVYSSSKKCRAAASDVVPKFVSPSDPAAWWTGPHKEPAFLAYSYSYLIDVCALSLTSMPSLFGRPRSALQRP
jgi:hypothetical protein